MADPQVRIEARVPATPTQSQQDVEMANNGEDKSTELEAPSGEAEAEADEVIAEASNIEDEGMKFLDYLRSPIVEIAVGADDDVVVLTSHQALLERSPYFVDALAMFSSDVTSRRIEMPNEDLDAVGCFLQFMYTSEYFPRRVTGNRLEIDAGDDGKQLLRHARVYTLASKLKVPALADLSLSKITLVESTARGEIEYARYVYGNTGKTDQVIRKPIAAFWGARSHILRHEAEDEFKKLCIDFPEFAFDVLTMVLDSKERARERERDRDTEVTKSGRKRARQT